MDRAAAVGDDGAARSGASRRPAGPSWRRVGHGGEPRRAKRAEADKAHADALKALVLRQGGCPSAAEHELHARRRGRPIRPPARAAAWPSPAGSRTREPADGPRGRQPSVGPPLRPRDRADGQRLRPQRPAAVAPGAARLAGRRTHGPRLEHEGDPSPDRHQRRPTGRIRGPTRPTSPATRTTSSSGDGPRGVPRPRSSATACSPSPAPRPDAWAAPTSITRPADRAPPQPVFPARRREADGVPPDLRRRRGDRVLPTQGEHPAPAGAGPGQQRAVASHGPPARPDALDTESGSDSSEFVDAAFERVLARRRPTPNDAECLRYLGEAAGSAEANEPRPRARNHRRLA